MIVKDLYPVQGGRYGHGFTFGIHELYNIYGVETIIRVGSCGGIREDVNVGDIVVVFSHTDNAMTSKFFNGTFCPSHRAFIRRYMELYSSIAYRYYYIK